MATEKRISVLLDERSSATLSNALSASASRHEIASFAALHRYSSTVHRSMTLPTAES